MNIKSCEKKEKSLAELVVEVSAEEFGKALNEAYVKNRNKISVPGFRKGKAPRGIIESRYGASVFHNDALDILIPEVMNVVVSQSDLKIISLPQVTDVDFKDNAGGLDIMITASLLPEVILGEYKGLTAYKPAVEISDGEVEKEIAAVRLRNARIEKADRPAITGDIAVIDYEGLIDGESFEGGKDEGYELELGSGTFIPGFEDNVLGMSAGEERDIDLIFPESYADHLAGKKVVFKIKMNEVREKQLPDLDDEFAKDVSEFDTFDVYKADIKAKMEKAKQNEADAVFENALMEKIAETMEADVPDVMVEQQMDDSMQNFAQQISSYGMEPSAYLQMMNTTPEAFRESMRESSKKQVKIMLALSKIAEIESVTVSDDEIENEYKEASAHYGMDIEKLKESVDAERISNDIKMRRAAKIVTESATADDKEPESQSPEPGDEEVAGNEKSKKTAAKKAVAKKPAGKNDEVNREDAEATAENKTVTVEEVKKPVKPAVRKTKKTAEPITKGDDTQ